MKTAYGARKTRPNDPVNHPSHYIFGGIEVIDAIEAWGLGYHLGNAVKYITRHNHKGKPIEDLQKAAWYLNRYVGLLQKRKPLVVAKRDVKLPKTWGKMVERRGATKRKQIFGRQ